MYLQHKFSSRNKKVVSSFQLKKAPYLELDWSDYVYVEVLRPSQPNGVMSSAVSLLDHMFTVQA